MSAARAANVLFLCTGNAARSLLCEAYLNAKAAGRLRAFSAGSHPKGEVHPLTLETLRAARLPAEGLRSKSWDEFACAGAPKMDIVITVCDSAAGEMCPVWPGQPVAAHWSLPDPAACTGSEAERRAIFLDVLRQIRHRIDIFRALPITRLSRRALVRELESVGCADG